MDPGRYRRDALVKLFVEGGGTSNQLRTECREAFNKFLRNAGVERFPRIVASGSRNEAFDDFCTAIRNDEAALLLVDSEDTVADENQTGDATTWKPWDHLKARDNWPKPKKAANADCHLMAECMENWFLADKVSVSGFFGQGFTPNQLPATHPSVESVAKVQVLEGLENASKKCKTKDPYGKGKHSFKILGLIDANLVVANAPWAKRFVNEVKHRFP